MPDMKVVSISQHVENGAFSLVDDSGTINNLECSIFSWFSGSNYDFLIVEKCSFLGTFLGHDQTGTSQETYQVEVGTRPVKRCTEIV